MLNIVLFGPPGAGKGTQSERLIEKYNLVHLSTGDIFRANIKMQSELGVLAKSYMDKGLLVPDSVTIEMLRSEVEKKQEASGFIFDGFPRTVAQAEALDRLLISKSSSISGMIALVVNDEELEKRLLNRGKASGRPDDANPEVIRKRIVEYNSKTAPVANYYKGQNKFTSINGIGTVDEIFESISTVVDNF